MHNYAYVDSMKCIQAPVFNGDAGHMDYDEIIHSTCTCVQVYYVDGNMSILSLTELVI